MSGIVEGMTRKLYKDLITTLVLGTSVYYISWDSKEKEFKIYIC